MTQMIPSQESEQKNDSHKSRDLSCGPSDSLVTAPETISDNDASEKPVREKLKKTSIASISQHAMKAQEILHTTEDNAVTNISSVPQKSSLEHGHCRLGDDDTRGRPVRKRSFDDLETAEAEMERASNTASGSSFEKANGHVRKRSRDVRTSESIKGDKQSRAVDTTLMEEGEGILLCISLSGS